ncbi:hypothetical protein ABZV77_18250 [Streptomyces sp. NPDC004732]|uniref:hypothetical protein n=1 Tax=Streptomyces sp. NPDC004732 TaxID=3154290 RepID=UPI0033AF49B0
MADEVEQQEDDQNLWRAVYTADRGWGEGTAFAEHLSVAAPALAEVDGTLCCVHRGARQGQRKRLPVMWTWFTPAATLPFVTALEEARAALPEGAGDEEKERQQEAVTAAAGALDAARKWHPDMQMVWDFSPEQHAVLKEARLRPPEDATDEQKERYGKAVEAAKAIQLSSPDSSSRRIESIETPTLVNDNGTLRMVFTKAIIFPGGDIWATLLWESSLDTSGDYVVWTPPTVIFEAKGMPLAPGVAVFNGAVHLVYVNPGSTHIQHLVRGADGAWAPVTGADGNKIATPLRGSRLADDKAANAALKAYGWPGNVALSVHGGQLHLVFRAEPGYKYAASYGNEAHEVTHGPLRHAVFDGTAWTDAADAGPKGQDGGPSPYLSRRGAALASHDGTLHAVFPSRDNKLCHGTWTPETGWSEPVTLKGHDSSNSPALLPFTDGPDGDERQVLLLVHRGVDRYVPPKPPTPPKPPALEDVAKRGTKVSGKLLTAYGTRDWSRLEHQFSLTPATMNNGKLGLIVTFEAWAQYCSRLGWWYRENYGGWYVPSLKVDFGLRTAGRHGRMVGDAQFRATRAPSGYWCFEKVFTGVEPGGDYEAFLFTSNTEKTGGYWWNSPSSVEDSQEGRNTQQYTRVSNFHTSTATITLPS